MFSPVLVAVAAAICTSFTVSALPASPVAAAPAAVPTLIPGWGFVRSVQNPTFHKYLTSATFDAPGKAILGEPEVAGLFKVSDGQLVQRLSSGGQLYATVEEYVGSSQKKLGITWTETAPSASFFMWSGDSLIWNNPSVPRSQSNAWLVCPDSAGVLDVFLNLGPYGWMTPAGCTDSTIHEYTGQTPD